MTSTNRSGVSKQATLDPGLAVIPIRTLAVVTGAACVVAQLLTHLEGVGTPDGGPWSVVVGQTIWNAAQVGFLLLLLCWNALKSHTGLTGLSLATAVLLPTSIYAISPGGLVLSAVIVISCMAARMDGLPNLGVSIAQAPARGAPFLSKFELLAFVCTLLCSMYNYNASRLCFPYWSGIYEFMSRLVGFSDTPADIANGMYTLGLNSVSLPYFIAAGRSGNNLGAVIFIAIWTVLPFLYVVYFALLALLARKTPARRIQQALCFYAIFHFLFLTDLVDYQFGRGILNTSAEWAHWSERFIWRLAILLPVYQKVMSGDLKHGNGRVGMALHYGLAIWATVFFIYQVLIYDLHRFYLFVTGAEDYYLELFGLSYRQELGYHGALVLMTTFYGVMIVAMRCQRVSTWRVAQLFTIRRPRPAP